MRIATWNVNSIRARVDRVVDWLERADVDVLAMQETKCRDDQFPDLPFVGLGYEVAHVGHSQWNGVAVASRVGLDGRRGRLPRPAGLGRAGRRRGARDRRDLRRGAGVEPVRAERPQLDDPHLAYKLDWLAKLRDAGAGWLADDPDAQVALCGDWNIAPRDEDVWDMAFFADSTHVSPPERAAFQAVVDAGYADVVRPYTRDRASSPTGTTQQLRFPGRRACGSTSRSPRRRWRSGSRAPRSSARSARARAPVDHAPVVVELGG